ncbi:O-methyltransferase [Rhodococcus sp. PvR099]|uniref:O-methyltransferase n=1 Tax=Rhodococcus sp. PvR099 TaxID=2806602 RepID=UPI001AE374A2|nr:O-methyltransferase [Rhodococcus sp. PvR099]MBP1162345.1 catechol O-methyltransferase [Rhodococcus sp. PvR099]
MTSRPVVVATFAAAFVGAAVIANRLAGKPVPFLRWSVIRFALGARRLLGEGQVGDGREEALAAHVLATARRGDLDDVIRAIDDFAHTRKFLMNVGDEKGEILDAAVWRARPALLLELGTYCGYSALRMARVMPPNATICTVEINPANEAIARRIFEHAGVGERITSVVGSIGDGGETMRRLRDEYGIDTGTVDFVFVDHLKSAYLPDLLRIVDEGWLHPGSRVVADNVRFPGAPDYLAFMRSEEGGRWRTTEHPTHVEYQRVLRDLVLESEYQG